MATKHFPGGRFGQLTLVSVADGDRRKWVVRCDCGAEKTVQLSNLISGRTTSCGCAHSAELQTRNRKHGQRWSSEYGVWSNMKYRCTNQNCLMYPRYGARGIKVCDRWSDFANFFADMGPRPTPAHSLDRIDNDSSYGPDNCRWATREEQAANTSRNRFVEVHGQRVIQAEAARRLGLTVSGLRYRMHAFGVAA